MYIHDNKLFALDVNGMLVESRLTVDPNGGYSIKPVTKGATLKVRPRNSMCVTVDEVISRYQLHEGGTFPKVVPVGNNNETQSRGVSPRR